MRGGNIISVNSTPLSHFMSRHYHPHSSRCKWPLICIILVYPEPTICHGSSISTAICWSVITPVRCQWWGWWCSLWWWLLGWRWECQRCSISAVPFVDHSVRCQWCGWSWWWCVHPCLFCCSSFSYSVFWISDHNYQNNVWQWQWHASPLLVHQPLWMAIHTTLHVNWQLSFYPLETSPRIWNELTLSKTTSKSEQFSNTHQSRGLHVKR